MATVPTRKTSERELDLFNQQLRSSPLYQNFMKSRGLRTDGHVKLSRKQQSDLETAMSRAGFTVPSGMHIDQGGNLNQKNRLLRNVGIGAALTAGTIATLGATGVIGGGALGGFGLGGAAAPVAGGTGAAAGSGVPLTGLPVLGGWGGAGTAVGAGGGSLAALASTPAAVSAAVPLAKTVAPAVTKASGGMGVPWFDIGSKAFDFIGNWGGAKTQAGADTRASELQYKTSQELLALEREKLAEDKRQAELTQAANERNFNIQQEERLENLRRQEEEEARAEPMRQAKEQAYRRYMKKYYGIDVAPSVARTPRTIAAGTVPGTKTPVPPQSNPLSALTQYGGSIVPSTPIAPQPAAADPFMQSWMLPQEEAMPYRRSLAQSATEY